MEAVEKKLKALQKLQNIDSKLDSILKVRGDLPEEVQDLEDEIAGYEIRIEKFSKQIEELELNITDSKQGIKNSETLITKYEEQQLKVRNNREFDAITKETELQRLEIQLFEKKIKESGFNIEKRTQEVEIIKAELEGRKIDLETKKGELSTIMGESEDEETKLNTDRQKASKNIEERYMIAYDKLRINARNGLAVVTVLRDACGGCFNQVPPQRQADIRDKKKIIVCEHCGRILADAELVIEEEKPKKKTTRKKKVAAE